MIAFAFLITLIGTSFAANNSTPYRNTNCVVFRLDDIQDYYLNQIQLRMLDIFKRNNTPITVGIISNFFNRDGGDATLIPYIKSATQDPTWNFEIANHGWNHEHFGSGGFNLSTQIQLMKDSLNRTLRDLAGYIDKIPTFIAPFNDFNNDTITAMFTVGFKYFSAQIATDPIRGAQKNATTNQILYHWPIGASTADLGDEESFIGVPWQTTFSQIQTQINASGFASVMMHAFEFSHVNITGTVTTYYNYPNETMFEQLENLLQAVARAGYNFCTLGELADRFADLDAIANNVTRVTTGNIRDGYSGSGTPMTTLYSTPGSSSSGSEASTSTGSVTKVVSEWTITVKIAGTYDEATFTSTIAVASGLTSSEAIFVIIVSAAQIELKKRDSDVTTWIITFYLDPSASGQMTIPFSKAESNLEESMKNPSVGSYSILSASNGQVDVGQKVTTGNLPVIHASTGPLTTTAAVHSGNNEINGVSITQFSLLLTMLAAFVTLF